MRRRDFIKVVSGGAVGWDWSDGSGDPCSGAPNNRHRSRGVSRKPETDARAFL